MDECRAVNVVLDNVQRKEQLAVLFLRLLNLDIEEMPFCIPSHDRT